MVTLQVILLALWIPLLFKCAKSQEEDPLLEYFINLQKTVTSGDGRLKESFPAAVFGVTDCGTQNELPRQEINELKDMTCVTSSLCKLDWFMFNWFAKGNKNGFPLAKVKIRVFKELVKQLLPEGSKTIQVNISAVVIQSTLNNLSFAEACPSNATFSCAGKQWIPVNSIEIKAESKEGWLELDLTPAINRTWLSKASKSTIKVALKLDSTDKVSINLVNPAMTGGALAMQKKLRSKQPHLLLYMKDQIQVNHTLAGGSSIIRSQSGNFRRRKRSSKTSCRLGFYSINFLDVNLNQILFPESVNIGICSGHCDFSFLSVNRKKGTNHAMIMARAFQLANETATSSSSITTPQPKSPCCVPVNYEGTLVIERDFFTKGLSVQVYPDLMATACGCR